jgi:NTE family protein
MDSPDPNRADDHVPDRDFSLEKRSIGLCLSGGGVRASVFHLGVLDWVAKSGLWDRVDAISTVSGGSLVVAMVFALAGRRWPDSREFVDEIEPRIRCLLTSWDLERAYKWSFIFRPWLLLRGRANVIAKLIRKHWMICGKVSDMPIKPLWIINATCYESGKNFRFTRNRMGDYLTNYVVDPHFSLSEAVAASAAVPGLIGPLSFKTAPFDWLRYEDNDWEKFGAPTIPVSPLAPRIQLWDGGVYDNLGVEALYKPAGGLREGIQTLIVSDASRPLGIELRRYKFGFPPYIAPIRLVDAATDQVRSIRARTLSAYFNTQVGAGTYLRMGDTARGIYESMNAPLPLTTPAAGWLDPNEVKLSASMPTTLRKLTEDEFRKLAAHGFEVANASMNSRLGTPVI